MKKLSINASWLLIIPLGIVFFVVVSQIQNTYQQFKEKEIKHLLNVHKLDSLRQIPEPSLRNKNDMKTLEVLVTVHGKVLENERYRNYKIGGMLLVLLIMFSGMFGSSYMVRRKKKSSTNQKIDFTYADPFADSIGQHISWEALKKQW